MISLLTKHKIASDTTTLPRVANRAVDSYLPFNKLKSRMIELMERTNTNPEKHEANEQKDKASAEAKEAKEQQAKAKAAAATKNGNSQEASVSVILAFLTTLCPSVIFQNLPSKRIQWGVHQNWADQNVETISEGGRGGGTGADCQETRRYGGGKRAGCKGKWGKEGEGQGQLSS